MGVPPLSLFFFLHSFQLLLAASELHSDAPVFTWAGADIEWLGCDPAPWKEEEEEKKVNK